MTHGSVLMDVLYGNIVYNLGYIRSIFQFLPNDFFAYGRMGDADLSSFGLVELKLAEIGAHNGLRE